MHHSVENPKTENPLFDHDEEIVKTESDHHIITSRSGKRLSVPNKTTLADKDWELIEDDLLPFQITVILVSLGAVALLGLGIHIFTGSLMVPFVQALSGGYPNMKDFLTLALCVPIFVALAQLFLALLFSGAAAFEKWNEVSIQDVISRHLPKFFDAFKIKHVHLHCTARGAYIWCMFIFLLFQTIIAGIALGVNDLVDNETNMGSDGGGNELVRVALDYSSAVFNTCCYDRGWSLQGRIPACTNSSGVLQTCPISDSNFNSLQSKLCACYKTPQAEYDSYVKFINSSQVCQLGNQVKVTIEKAQKIPGTNYNMRLVIPKEVSQIPIVGNPATEYGCGIGFLRGFQWSLVEWSTAQLRPYFVGILAISGIQIILLILGTSVICRVRQTREMGEDGNYIYSPHGIKGLHQGKFTITSPALNFKRKGSSGGMLPASPNNLLASPFAPVPSEIVISSPEMMKNAAYPSTNNKPSSKIVDIDSAI